MKIAIVGGGPGGLYFAALMKQLDPIARRHRLGTQRRQRHLRLRRRLLRRDPRRHRQRGHRDRRVHVRALRPLDRHRHPLPGPAAHRRRPGLRRHEPQGAARAAAAAVRRTRRRPALQHAGARRRGTQPGLRSGPRRGRPELRRPLPLRRGLPAQPGRPQVQVHVARHRPRLRGVQVLRQGHRARRHADPRLPLLGRGQHLHRRNARGRLAQRRLRRHRAPGVPARRKRRGGRGRHPRPFSPRSSTATRSWSTTPSGSTSPRSATSPGGTATSCSWATPPTPRTSPSGPAPSWPWRTPSPWRPACTSTPSSRPRWRRTRRSAGRWSNPPSAPRRPRWSGSRTSACTRTRTRCSSAFNLLTRSRRITYDNLQAARPRVRRPGGRGIRPHAGHRRQRPGHVPAVPDRRAGTEEPDRRLTDGHVLRHRRRPGQLPPGPPRQQGPRRRRPGDDRDGLRLRDRPHHAGLQRPLHRRPAGELARDRRLRAQPFDGDDRRPAGALRPQGLHQTHVGGHRRAAPRGRLGAGGPLGHPLRPGQPGAARNQPRRDGPGPGRVRRRDRPCGRRRASTCWSCTARTATCSRPSFRRWPTGATDEYGGSLGEPAALPAGGVRRRPRGVAR